MPGLEPQKTQRVWSFDMGYRVGKGSMAGGFIDIVAPPKSLRSRIVWWYSTVSKSLPAAPVKCNAWFGDAPRSCRRTRSQPRHALGCERGQDEQRSHGGG